MEKCLGLVRSCERRMDRVIESVYRISGLVVGEQH